MTQPNATYIDLRQKMYEFSNETFGINFINAISIFEALRFSPWMIARSYTYRIADANMHWSTRRPVTYYTQVGQNMVSLEYIIELGNTLNKDIWLSIPAEADEDFISNMANYTRDNFNPNNTIYVEQGSNKGFNGNNRTLQMEVIRIWKSSFGDERSRLFFIMSTSSTYYFENVMSVYNDLDIVEFDAFAVSGKIASSATINSNDFNVSLSVNYTTSTIIDIIQQQIYFDEIRLIYMALKAAITLNIPLIGYDVGFLIHAPGWNNRWKKTSLAPLEQKLEDLVIESLRLSIVEDLYLDYFERWYKIGAGIMFIR